MGKVKTYTEKEIRTLAVYQSPMGKVKYRKEDRHEKDHVVSIPYGKGKEQHFVLCF